MARRQSTVSEQGGCRIRGARVVDLEPHLDDVVVFVDAPSVNPPVDDRQTSRFTEGAGELGLEGRTTLRDADPQVGVVLGN